MDKTSAAAQLRDLAAGSQRSKAARLRDMLDDVEAALSAGVSRADVVDVLRRNGLDISVKYFDLMRSRFKSQKPRITKPGRAPNVPLGTAGKASPSESMKDAVTPVTAATEIDTPFDSDAGNTTGRAKSTAPYDPKALRRIMENKPDLEAYAKLARKGNK